MRSVNKVILIGNLTRDPELKTTQSGQPLATFGLATNRSWTSSGGQKQTSAEFHELVAWARLAEFAAQNLRKGKLVYVEGYLKTRSWESEDGTRRFKTEVIVQDLIILSKRSDGGYDEEEGMSMTDSEMGGDMIIGEDEPVETGDVVADDSDDLF